MNWTATSPVCLIGRETVSEAPQVEGPKADQAQYTERVREGLRTEASLRHDLKCSQWEHKP